MEKIRIGIICPSEIAFRRFMPALSKLNDIYEFAGIAIASDDEWNGSRTVETKNIEIQKAKSFIDQYGGKMYESYTSLINDEQVEAVYIPLPPALHYQWAKLALQNNKHVFVEKPSSTRLEHTKELTELANAKKLVLHENYMFIYHHQIEKIQQIIEKGKLGDVRLIRANFGFPKRPANDFRYN